MSPLKTSELQFLMIFFLKDVKHQSLQKLSVSMTQYLKNFSVSQIEIFSIDIYLLVLIIVKILINLFLSDRGVHEKLSLSRFTFL